MISSFNPKSNLNSSVVLRRVWSYRTKFPSPDYKRFQLGLFSLVTRHQGPDLTQQTAAIVVRIAPYSPFISQRAQIIGSAGRAV